MNGSRLSALVSFVILCFLATASLPADEGAFNLLRNPGFERGQNGWNAAWQTEGGQVVLDKNSAHSGSRFLLLTADDANVGVDSDPLYAATDFDVSEAHIVSAWVSNLGVSRGGFGLRLYCYDAKGKYLAMRSLGDLAPDSPKTGWQKIEARVGPGTDFPFPKGVDRVVVRFSFWAKEGGCKGTVRIDDVFFGPIRSERPLAARSFKRTQKGGVAIWKDKVPVVGAASDPDYLASLLEEAGFGVNLITTGDMTDAAILDPANFDLLILPYGETYPARGADSLRRYLRGGGGLISLGGRCFSKPIYASAGGWIASVALRSDEKSARPMVRLSSELAASLAAETHKGEEPVEISLGKDPDGDPALRVVVPDLKTYKYVPFDILGIAGCSIIHFRARGDENTKHLCIEVNEADDSRWKAVVDLSTEWKAYEISTGEFVSYATENRGGKGDYLHPERVKKISLGFPRGLVGSGAHIFEVSEIEWRRSDVPPEELAPGSMLLVGPSDLFGAFGAQLKPPGGAGDVTAFFASEEFEDATGLHAAPNQTIFPKDLKIEGNTLGWTTTILDNNLHFLEKRKTSRDRTFLPTEKLARTVPLLVTSKGLPAAALFINTGGRYADSVWACFGVANRDLFPHQDKEMGKAFAALVERMLCGAFFTAIEPRFTVHDGHSRMEVMVEVTNRGAVDIRLELRSRLLPLSGKAFSMDVASEISLAPRETREFVAIEADARNFDWKAFKVECALVEGGQAVDVIETTVDVRGTLLAVCDRFVARQKERGDSKFHGYAFVDNRGARGLLAAYDLAGNKQYLQAAIAWGDALIAEQREDGGYLMGYGYYPDGNACFVADGGEIACGIARLITYVPEKDKKRFMDSLKAYMGFRDSFRCEGGGIGVGWCKSDYGARPIKPLDKITRIYAPELNIYTIGCTLTSATMYALLTRDEKDNDAAVRDAYWWMKRCDKMSGGAFVESAVWANKFLRGENISTDTEQFLREKFIPHVIKPENRWWTTGAGRTVQGMDGLAYYCDCIEKDPNVLAALMRVTYHVCSPDALSGIPRIISKNDLSQSEWIYLNFASVSLPDLLESEIIRKRFY